jgi:hypothetical protein
MLILSYEQDRTIFGELLDKKHEHAVTATKEFQGYAVCVIKKLRVQIKNILRGNQNVWYSIQNTDSRSEDAHKSNNRRNVS